jgi:hypothetical protein
MQSPKPLPRLLVYLHAIGVLGACDSRYAQRVHMRHGAPELLRRLTELERQGKAETILMTKYNEAQGIPLVKAFAPYHKFSNAPMHGMLLHPGRYSLDLHLAERAARAGGFASDARYVYVDFDVSHAAPSALTVAVSQYRHVESRADREAAKARGEFRSDDATLANLGDVLEILADTAPTPVAQVVPTLPQITGTMLHSGERCNVVIAASPGSASMHAGRPDSLKGAR